MNRAPRGILPLIGHTFRHGFDWSGRATRKELWAYTVMLMIVLIALALVEVSRGGMPGQLPRYGLPLLALLVLPLPALFARRLHDTGRSGAWVLVALVPFVSLLVLAYLLFAPSGRAYRGSDRTGVVALLGPALSLVLSVLVASRVFWAPYFVPSGAMAPTLVAGDYLIASRPLSYMPVRGDVVVVSSGITGSEHVKRLIGLPGDRVSLKGGIIFLNGAALPQTPDGDYTVTMGPGPGGTRPACANAPVGDGAACVTPRRIEEPPGHQPYRILDLGMTALDDLPEVTVPEGHLFALGDNRDNSRDSRVLPQAGGLGMIPVDAVRARAAFVLWSVAGQHWYELWTLRPDRFLMGVK